MAMACKEEMRPPRPTTTTLHDVPYKLVGLILRRLDSPLSVVRAAATCKPWRRLIADGMPDIHRPHPHQSLVVAGDYHDRASSGPVFVPSSPPLGVDGRHFSLDFLPGGGDKSWELVDSRRSVLLLARKKAGWMRRCFPDLVVCEPATRRYQLIPRMEQMKRHHCLGAFLQRCEGAARWSLSGRRRMEGSMATFKVLCVLYQEHAGVSVDGGGTVRACVFDRYSACGTSRIKLHRRHSWYADDEAEGSLACSMHLRGTTSLHFIGRAADTLFWSIEDDDESLLAFTSCFGKFWLPEHVQGSSLRVINSDGEYDKMRVVSLQRSSELRVFETRLYGGRGDEWVLQKSLRLPEATRRLAGQKEEYLDGGGALEIVTADMRSVVLAPAAKTWMFSVDLDTMEVAECRCKTKAYPCELPWPPAMNYKLSW